MTASIRQRIPACRDQAVNIAKPEIARDVPDNLFDFVEARRSKGLRVDGELFTWEGHEYLIEPYKAFQVAGEHSETGLDVAWECGAQVGKSIGAMLSSVWLSLRFWARYFGYFLPDKEMAMLFSAIRFKPLCLSIPELVPIWGEDPTAEDGARKKSDQKRVRSIGPSQIFFSYMGGVTSTESIPMLGMIRDEVRRMLDGDIERSRERLSHSPYPINFDISTAGYPEVNIDKAFRAGNQNKFHSFCKCPDGVVLADVFPDSVGERLEGFTPGLQGLPKRFWVCPVCKEPITNPRDGRWIPHNPSAPAHKVSYHVPQTLSCRMTADRIFHAFLSAADITEFYNSKLGVPHISKEAQLVTTEILRTTVNPDLKWLREGINFAMGIDQMGGFNVVTLRYWGPKDMATGLHKSRLAHLEMIYDIDPFARCDELMQQFDVSVCVCDGLPNYNDAQRFAQRHKGKVFLADYSYESRGDGDICEWGDRPKETVSDRKKSDEVKNKHTVRISRFHGIEWNLMKYVHRLKEQPHEKGLVAEVEDVARKKKTVFLCEDVFWIHLQKVAKRKHVIDEMQGKFKMVFENIGLDPHFLHADLYCELALSRIRPDAAGKAFHDFTPPEEGETDHRWEPLSNPSHFRCAGCGLAIAVRPGETAQAAAERLGRKECER